MYLAGTGMQKDAGKAKEFLQKGRDLDRSQ
jgi:hypothetical protein